MKILGLMILVIGMSGAAMAQDCDDDFDGCPTAVPEINGSLATGAVALLSGTIVLVRSRYKK